MPLIHVTQLPMFMHFCTPFPQMTATEVAPLAVREGRYRQNVLARPAPALAIDVGYGGQFVRQTGQTLGCGTLVSLGTLLLLWTSCMQPSQCRVHGGCHLLGLAGSHKYCPKPVTAIVIIAIIAVIMAVNIAIIAVIMAVIIAIMAVIIAIMAVIMAAIMAAIIAIMAVIIVIMAVILAIMAVIMLFMHIYTPCIIASCHVLSVSQPDAPSGPPEVNTELHLRLPQIYKNSQTHHKK